MKIKELAIKNKEELYFGYAPHPVTTQRGLIIGGGHVYPELNFTLPAISVVKENMKAIRGHYSEIVTNALDRALELNSEGMIFEFETVMEMTKSPEIGVELVKVMNDICEE